MIAAFVVSLFAGTFIGLWMYEADRSYRFAARTAKEMHYHASAARTASKNIQEAIQGMEINPDFQPILEMMLRHDRDNVEYCDKAYRRYRDKIPKKLWARYGVPED